MAVPVAPGTFVRTRTPVRPPPKPHLPKRQTLATPSGLASVRRRSLSGNTPAAHLAGDITSAVTSLTVRSGEGNAFPSPTSTMPMFVVVARGTSTEEKLKVTARAGDIFTVVRGQDSFTAVAHSAGSTVELCVDVQMIQDLNAFGSSIAAKGEIPVLAQFQGTTGLSFGKRAPGLNDTVFAPDAIQLDGVNWTNHPLAILRLSVTNQSVPSNTIFAFNWDTELEDSHNLFTVGQTAPPAQPGGGLWMCTLTVDLTNYAAWGIGASDRVFGVTQDPNPFAYMTVGPRPNAASPIYTETFIGRVDRVGMIQNSGGAVNVSASLTAVRLAL